jgi:hypothetical protein
MRNSRLQIYNFRSQPDERGRLIAGHRGAALRYILGVREADRRGREAHRGPGMSSTEIADRSGRSPAENGCNFNRIGEALALQKSHSYRDAADRGN